MNGFVLDALGSFARLCRHVIGAISVLRETQT